MTINSERRAHGLAEIMHGTQGAAPSHPVKCPAALEDAGATAHGGPCRCKHPAPTAEVNDVPGFLEHECGYVGCRVLWTRPSPAMARMGLDELRLLVDGPDMAAVILAENEAKS